MVCVILWKESVLHLLGAFSGFLYTCWWILELHRRPEMPNQL